jgi:hypothetical protein
MKEAVDWAQRFSVGLSPRETIIIVGLGSGYHVKSLRSLLPDVAILVIEPDQAVVNAVFDLLPELQDEKVLVESEMLSLTDRPEFRDFTGGLYRIAPHGPTCQIHREWSDRVIRLLLGRDHLSLLLQLRMRPDLLSILDEHKLTAEQLLADNPGPMSLKTMKNLFRQGTESSSERRIWRCLEELVK